MPLDSVIAGLPQGALSGADCDALRDVAEGSKIYRRGQIISQPDRCPSQLHLVSSGWATRCLLFEDGSRQITDFLLKGDICDLPGLYGSTFGQVSALTTVRVTLLSRSKLLEALERRPKLALAFLALGWSNETRLRTWLGCVGRRTKLQAVSHLFCELHERLQRLGLVGDHSFDLPVSQQDIADAIGMTTVHANRMIQQLREGGLIRLYQRHLTILQPQQLRDLAEFDATYLRAA